MNSQSQIFRENVLKKCKPIIKSISDYCYTDKSVNFNKYVKYVSLLRFNLNHASDEYKNVVRLSKSIGLFVGDDFIEIKYRMPPFDKKNYSLIEQKISSLAQKTISPEFIRRSQIKAVCSNVIVYNKFWYAKDWGICDDYSFLIKIKEMEFIKNYGKDQEVTFLIEDDRGEKNENRKH